MSIEEALKVAREEGSIRNQRKPCGDAKDGFGTTITCLKKLIVKEIK